MSTISEIHFRKSIISIQSAFGNSYASEDNANLTKLYFGNERARNFYDLGGTGLKITEAENTWN